MNSRALYELKGKSKSGPGRARISPARIFSTSAKNQRSGVGFAAGRLCGGRVSDLPPRGSVEVGNAAKVGPWRLRIHQSRQGSGKSKPGKDFLDLR